MWHVHAYLSGAACMLHAERIRKKVCFPNYRYLLFAIPNPPMKETERTKALANRKTMSLAELCQQWENEEREWRQTTTAARVSEIKGRVVRAAEPMAEPSVSPVAFYDSTDAPPARARKSSRCGTTNNMMNASASEPTLAMKAYAPSTCAKLETPLPSLTSSLSIWQRLHAEGAVESTRLRSLWQLDLQDRERGGWSWLDRPHQEALRQRVRERRPSAYSLDGYAMATTQWTDECRPRMPRTPRPRPTSKSPTRPERSGASSARAKPVAPPETAEAATLGTAKSPMVDPAYAQPTVASSARSTTKAFAGSGQDAAPRPVQCYEEKAGGLCADGVLQAIPRCSRWRGMVCGRSLAGADER